MNPNYADDPGMKRPGRGPAAPARGVSEGTWKHPACPGAPRKVHKPLGRKVKTSMGGNV